MTAIVKGPVVWRGWRKNLQCGSSEAATPADGCAVRRWPIALSFGLRIPVTASTRSIRIASAMSHLAPWRAAADHRGGAWARCGLNAGKVPLPRGTAGCLPPTRNIHFHNGQIDASALLFLARLQRDQEDNKGRKCTGTNQASNTDCARSACAAKTGK